jgi:hypothetical protein
VKEKETTYMGEVGVIVLRGLASTSIKMLPGLSMIFSGLPFLVVVKLGKSEAKWSLIQWGQVRMWLGCRGGWSGPIGLIRVVQGKSIASLSRI